MAENPDDRLWRREFVFHLARRIAVCSQTANEPNTRSASQTKASLFPPAGGNVINY